LFRRKTDFLSVQIANFTPEKSSLKKQIKMSTPKFHALKIADVRQEIEDAVSIAFEVPEELKAEYHFKPGQYLTMRTQINGQEVRRSYSICSAPYENELRVAIKRVKGGIFSNYANENLHAGNTIDVMTPMGNFTTEIHKNQEKTYVLFAGGSGITPILSLIKTVLVDEPKSKVTLIYGNRKINSIIFKEEIDYLKNLYLTRFAVVHILSEEYLGNDVQYGLMDKAKTDQLNEFFLKQEKIDEAFICGPQPMILAIQEKLLAYGMSEKAVHVELFSSQTPAKPISATNEPKIEANVKIIMDGIEQELHIDSDGESILDAAYKSGLDVPFACKGGVCCTCKAKVLEGSVKMDVNYALEPDEVANGYILTCQSHPTSEKVVVSFDD
jgi:ring-1,2-phenylacetyl-CoA epoxidase subunit PaaE